MATKSFDSYFSAFKKDYAKVVGNLKPYHAFTAFCANYFYFAESSEDLDEDFLSCMPDGGNDGGVDAMFANPLEDSNELVIVQGKFYKKSSLGLQELKDELNKIIDTLHDLKEHKHGSLNNKVTAAYCTETSDLDDDFTIRIDFCTLATPTKTQLAQMKNACAARAASSGYQIRLLTREDILRRVVSCVTASETVAQHTLKIDKANNALRYGDSVIVNVSAQSLQDLYKQHQNRVLGRNLRYHIKDKVVDDAIKDTIEAEPENFWYLNNGILIACDDYMLAGTNLELMNFSIVNGGQTTFKVANAKDLSVDFFLQCKVVKMKGTTEDERNAFCHKIANATNSQKPIKPADLKSNAPEQAHLKSLLHSLDFYYVTKAGDKPQKKIYKNYQIANLDKVSKAGIAGILLMPGTARSGASKIYRDDDMYKAIFDSPLPNVITDLLTLTYYFKAFQRNAVAKAEELGFDDADKLPAIKNGEKYYLACIALLAKIRAKAFTYSEFKAVRGKSLDQRNFLLWRNGNLTKIITASTDVQGKANKVFSFLTKKVLAPCCKLGRRIGEENGKPFVHANYFKSDESFLVDIADELWSQYIDEESFKQAVDELIG